MTNLRKDGKPKNKSGRKPLPPEVREARKAAQQANRHTVTVSFPTAELVTEVNEMLGTENRARTMLAALIFWHRTDPEAKA